MAIKGLWKWALPMAALWGATPVFAWRSTLYPEDWKPGYEDNKGHFLQDFSYAGYHYGEQALPERKDKVTDITQAPYQADNTGARDSTVAIQQALDDVGKAGGGVVFMPSGTYSVSPQDPNKDFVLLIKYDNVVLRGAGPEKTFLYNSTNVMRGKKVIKILSEESGPTDNIIAAPVGASGAPESLITEDLPKPSLQVPVKNVSQFAVGDLVVVRNDLTKHYIDLIGMGAKWKPAASPNRTLTYYRRIKAIDPMTKTLTMDIPVRGFLFKADNARVVKFTGHMITEVGLEDFSIGMKQHPGTGMDNDDEINYQTPGTAAYDVSWACGVDFIYAENCWMRRVNSYCPPGNSPIVHILSDGVRLTRSRLVTLDDCSWAFAQFQGGGGNGYLYTLMGNDCLINNCKAESGRHNFSFGTMASSGNVIHNLYSKNGSRASDFHMFLSLGNLLDNISCDKNVMEAQYRPWGGNPVHGVTTTESVFWNTNGIAYPWDKETYKKPMYILVSKQYGNGYVIGTRGPASAVNSTNFVEGEGRGDSLEPASLYEDQLKRRLAQ